MRLSKNFTLQELTKTSRKLDNTPGIKELQNLKRLADTLQLVRDLVGRPVIVTSGYRSPAVNKAVGGSSTSAHSKGLAADISVPGMPSTELARLIRDSDIEYDQLILEYPDKPSAWVHIGLSENKLRMQQLTIRTGTGYMLGIA